MISLELLAPFWYSHVSSILVEMSSSNSMALAWVSSSSDQNMSHRGLRTRMNNTLVVSVSLQEVTIHNLAPWLRRSMQRSYGYAKGTNVFGITRKVIPNMSCLTGLVRKSWSRRNVTRFPNLVFCGSNPMLRHGHDSATVRCRRDEHELRSPKGITIQIQINSTINQAFQDCYNLCSNSCSSHIFKLW